MSFQTCMSFFLMLNTKEDILKDFEEPNSCWSPLTEKCNGSQWGPSTFWLPAFFKISSFIFNIRKKLIQVWNDMRVSKWWQNLIFAWTIPLINAIKKVNDTFYKMLPPKIKKNMKLQKCVTVPVVLEDTWVPEDPVCLCLLNHLARLLSGTAWPSCSCTLSRLHSPAWHPNNLQLLQSIPHSPSCFTSFTVTKKALVRCVAVYVQHVLCVHNQQWESLVCG